MQTLQKSKAMQPGKPEICVYNVRATKCGVPGFTVKAEVYLTAGRLEVDLWRNETLLAESIEPNEMRSALRTCMVRRSASIANKLEDFCEKLIYSP